MPRRCAFSAASDARICASQRDGVARVTGLHIADSDVTRPTPRIQLSRRRCFRRSIWTSRLWILSETTGLESGSPSCTIASINKGDSVNSRSIWVPRALDTQAPSPVPLLRPPRHHRSWPATPVRPRWDSDRFSSAQRVGAQTDSGISAEFVIPYVPGSHNCRGPNADRIFGNDEG